LSDPLVSLSFWILLYLYLFIYFFFLLDPPPPRSTLFPYTTLFRSSPRSNDRVCPRRSSIGKHEARSAARPRVIVLALIRALEPRSEEHTSELQSRGHLVCRLLLEKKKKKLKRSRSYSR